MFPSIFILSINLPSFSFPTPTKIASLDCLGASWSVLEAPCAFPRASWTHLRRLGHSLVVSRAPWRTLAHPGAPPGSAPAPPPTTPPTTPPRDASGGTTGGLRPRQRHDTKSKRMAKGGERGNESEGGKPPLTRRTGRRILNLGAE